MQKNVIIAVLCFLVIVMLIWPAKRQPANVEPAQLDSNLSRNSNNNSTDQRDWGQSRQVAPTDQRGQSFGSGNAPYPYPNNNDYLNNAQYYNGQNLPYGNQYNQPGLYGMPQNYPGTTDNQSFYPQSPYSTDTQQYSPYYIPRYRFRDPSKSESKQLPSGDDNERYSSPRSNRSFDSGYMPYRQNRSNDQLYQDQSSQDTQDLPGRY